MESLPEIEDDSPATNNHNHNNNNNNKDSTKSRDGFGAIRKRLKAGGLRGLSVPASEEVTSLSSLPSMTSSLLTPPSPYHLERCGSTSSLDSSVSQQNGWGKRRRRSSSRLSELDYVNHDVTLLSFARKTRQSMRSGYAFTRRILHKVLRQSSRYPVLVCEGEVMDETDKICRKYIVHKMTLRDLMSRKVTISACDWPRASHVIAAGMALEHTYPKTFSNVSRKLCMTMSSAKIVRTALTSVLEVIFEGGITWGKMVAMMSVSALFAEECASQGHADFVAEVVDTVLDLTSSKLLKWLVQEGGWASFPCGAKDDGPTLTLTQVASVVGLTATVFLSSRWLLDFW